MTKECKEKAKTLEKISNEAFKELVKLGTVERYAKVRSQIYFDENHNGTMAKGAFFVYYNPYYKNFIACGKFKD